MSRLFFALWPDAGTRSLLLSVLNKIPPECGRLIVAGNLHITLVFLGNIDEGKTECILNQTEHITVPPFALKLDQLGWWKKAETLWLAPAFIPPEVLTLEEKLKVCATECAVRIDERPYQPHVTLARKVRHQPDLPVIQPLDWRIKGFSLIQSETRPEGARYKVIWSSV